MFPRLRSALATLFLFPLLLPGSPSIAQAAASPAVSTGGQSQVVQQPVSFTVHNINRSKIPCTADGRTYTVRGPRGRAKTGPRQPNIGYLIPPRAQLRRRNCPGQGQQGAAERARPARIGYRATWKPKHGTPLAARPMAKSCPDSQVQQSGVQPSPEPDRWIQV